MRTRVAKDRRRSPRRPPPRSVPRADAGLFRELASRWRSETDVVSSVSEMVLNPAYQQIIGMGPNAVPFLLRELERESGHWFWALEAITRTNPVDPHDQGDVPAMRAAWLQWGKRHGYLR